MDTVRLKFVLRRDPVSGVNGVTAQDVDTGTLYRTGHMRTGIAMTKLRILIHQHRPGTHIEATGSVELE